MGIRIADKRTLTSLDDIREAKPEMAFCSVKTCWWTTNPDDLCCDHGHPMKECPAGYDSIPLDPSGSPLFQTDDVEGFLKEAEDNAEHYGRHGLEAFILAYDGNVVADEEAAPYHRCSSRWDSYNDLLDLEEAQP